MGFLIYTLLTCLKYLVILIDFITDKVFGFIYNGKHKTLPAITNPILLETATSLAAKIRSKKLTSREVVQSFINRINELNPILNSVIDTCFDEALRQADEVDRKIQADEITAEQMLKDTPFMGVPFTTKDSLAIKGCYWTAGLVSRKGKTAPEDSDAVAMMRKAGAIPLAVTNVSELCMWWESSNNLYGRTNNPYDTTRIVGGSSGGEGSLITAAGTPFGIGSDIGGSIRLPSFFNGIFGHKPSKDIVSNGGQFPVAEGLRASILLTGPMCRYATDLLPLLKCLGGADVPDKIINSTVNLKDLKVYYMENDGGIPVTTPVDKESRAAFNKVVQHFKTQGLNVEKVNLKKIMWTMEMWTTQINTKDVPSFSEEMTERNGSVNAFAELLKWLFRRSSHTLPAIALAISEKVTSSLKEEGERRTHFVNMLEELKKEFYELLGDDGIFLYPSQPKPAPYHNQPLFQPFSFLYTALFNALHLPVTQCPLGLSSGGLPLGIQVAAAPYNDHLCLTVAAELEKAFGGWVCPSAVLPSEQ